MEERLMDPGKLLAQNVSGFHCYDLSPRRNLTYVSDNLCSLLGVDREHLTEGGDGYAARIHPEDRAKYDDALQELSSREMSCTLFYRIAGGNGNYLQVTDTLISSQTSRGTMEACSVLADITELNRLRKEREAARYLQAFSEIYDRTFDFRISDPAVGSRRVRPKVRIRTFGFFDVFVEERPIAFRNEKSKELLALLVDRRGGYLSSEEAITYLWEDEPANQVTLARYRKVALRLKNTLEEYGIGEIVEAVNGKRRLVTDAVCCDLYEHLSGENSDSRLFKGSYLSNYSWGETTLAELTGEENW